MRLPWDTVRVMGCTRAEFVRWWHSFTLDESDFSNLSCAAVALTGSSVQFDIEALEPRRIGLAVIPQLKVTVSYPQGESSEALAWVAKFDHYTQRGGG